MGRKIPDSLLEPAFDAYANGATLQQAAALVGVSWSTLLRRLRQQPGFVPHRRSLSWALVAVRGTAAPSIGGLWPGGDHDRGSGSGLGLGIHEAEGRIQVVSAVGGQGNCGGLRRSLHRGSQY